MARHSVWTRAKHPDGLERPHFWQLKAGQNVMGSLQPRKQGSALFATCFARVLKPEQTNCNADFNTSRIGKEGQPPCASENNVKATQAHNPSGAPAGGSHAQPGQAPEFIDANLSYLVSQAPELLLRNAAESNRWACQHRNVPGHGNTKETCLLRLRNKHETPFTTIRCAREYNVVKTACLAPCGRFIFVAVARKGRIVAGGSHCGSFWSVQCRSF